VEVWLRKNLPDVMNAAMSLEAFSRLLQHEIAELYEDWFRDRRPAGELDAVHYAVGKKAWFGTLTTNELATLAAAREQADFMTHCAGLQAGYQAADFGFHDLPRNRLERSDQSTPTVGGPAGGPAPGRAATASVRRLSLQRRRGL